MKHRDYCLDLTHRLQQSVGHEIYFALALADYCAPEDFHALETILGLAAKLHYEELGDEQRAVREDLKRRNLRRTGLSKKGIRRVFKVRRIVDA